MSPPAGAQSELTVGAMIDEVADHLSKAKLFYGHGTDNAFDEAAALVFAKMDLDHAQAAVLYEQVVPDAAAAEILELADLRISSRRPLAYLVNEAWFAGYPFFVDERVLVPRSPVAELIDDQFQPWIDPSSIRNILEVGTGSGCIAIACALTFPAARITATDISPQALEVATINVARHGLQGRLRLLEADLLAGVQGSFDIIVINPPYVPDKQAAELPEEYGFEPALGLYSGKDGLDAARLILESAAELLTPHGILVLEVGAQWEALDRAFPGLPFTWLEFERGGEGVCLLNASDLR